MKKFNGRIWVSENDHQVVKIDMVAHDDINIGWGLVGRVHQRQPARVLAPPGQRRGVAAGRGADRSERPHAAVPPVPDHMRTEYFDYKKWSVDTCRDLRRPAGTMIRDQVRGQVSGQSGLSRLRPQASETHHERDP